MTSSGLALKLETVGALAFLLSKITVSIQFSYKKCIFLTVSVCFISFCLLFSKFTLHHSYYCKMCLVLNGATFQTYWFVLNSSSIISKTFKASQCFLTFLFWPHFFLYFQLNSKQLQLLISEADHLLNAFNIFYMLYVHNDLFDMETNSRGRCCRTLEFVAINKWICELQPTCFPPHFLF